MSGTTERLKSYVPARVRHQSARLRILLGLLVSVVFLGLTVSGVDLPLVGRLILAASPVGLLLALLLIGVELLLRAYRWQLLLRGLVQARYRQALAFLCIGYFANSVLPARLGDLARAYLAGNAFGAPRLGTLGTIMVERLADGLTMLGVTLVAGTFMAGGGVIRDAAWALLAVGLAGLAVLAIGLLAGRRIGLAGTRLGRWLQEYGGRVLAGTRTLRTLRGWVGLVATTLLAFAVAVLVLHSVANAVGLGLPLEQAALVSAGLALSLAIPAAPGSLGTYEFVGVSILIGLGYPAAASLATVVLVHVLVTLPAAFCGLLAMWLYQLRVATIVDSAEAAEAQARP